MVDVEENELHLNNESYINFKTFSPFRELCKDLNTFSNNALAEIALLEKHIVSTDSLSEFEAFYVDRMIYDHCFMDVL